MATDEPTPAAYSTDASDDTANTPDEVDTRQRFREALARKREREHLGGAAPTAVQHPHAAPAKPNRTFRRKSG
jgi:hypothetical protein